MTCKSTRTQSLTSTLTDHVTEVETIAGATLSFQLHAAGTHKSNCDIEAAACQHVEEHTFWIKKGSFRSFKCFTVHSWIGLDILKTECICECSCVRDCTFICPCAFWTLCHESIPGLFSRTCVTRNGGCWLCNTFGVWLAQSWVHWHCSLNSLMTWARARARWNKKSPHLGEATAERHKTD